MAEHALSQELLCSEGGRSLSYLVLLAKLQLLKGDYSSAADSLKEALLLTNEVLLQLCSQQIIIFADSTRFLVKSEILICCHICPDVSLF